MVRTSNNVNDNENVGTTNNYNVNDNDRYSKSKKVEVIADELVKKLNAKPDSRPFFCKVAWRLSEATIWRNFESAQKGKNRIGLFIYLCKRDGV